MTSRLNTTDFNWLVSASTIQSNSGQNLTLDVSSGLINFNTNGQTYARFDTSFNFTNLPFCSKNPVTNPQLVNKNYVDGIQNYTLNIPSNTTFQKQPITSLMSNIITTSSINQNIDGWTNNQQVYTFGQSIPNRWVAVGAGTNSIAYSGDGFTWSGLSTNIFSTQGFGVFWNGNIWVAVGQGTNSIAYSNDGIIWTGIGTSIFTSGRCVLWGDNKWVAGGSGANNLAYSYDGINWIGIGTSLFGSSNNANGLAWNGLRWVVIGGGTASPPNTFAYSSDGISWTGLGTIIFTGGTFIGGADVAWNGLMFVAVGGRGSISNSIAYSYNGIAWTGLGTGQYSYYGTSISWNGSRWVAFGSNGSNGIFYSSTNGINWTLGNTTIFNSAANFSGASKIYWNGTKFIAVCSSTNNSFAYSLDGIAWTQTGSTSIFPSASGVAFNNARRNTIKYPTNLTLAGGLTVPTYTFSIAYSYDGITNWTGAPGSSNIFTVANCFEWNGSMWVAGGQSTNNTAYSYDGINWYGTGTTVFSASCNGVAWGDNKWVGVGQGNVIGYSYDGINWIGLNASSVFVRGLGIIWDGKKYIAGGTGTLTPNTIAYSYNGINWTGLGTSIFTSCSYFAKNGTTIVAVGSGANSIAYSNDGINWIGVGTSMFSSGWRVTWNGGMFLAGGSGGPNSLAYSYNGISWTGLGTSVFGTSTTNVLWNGRYFIASGGSPPRIAYSADGVNNWTTTSSITSIFGTATQGLGWNGGIGSVYIQQPIVATGRGTNTLAYSPDGIQWTGLGTNIFSTYSWDVFWNGTIWLALGQGTNSIAYSYDGTTWTGLGTSTFSVRGLSTGWNGSLWVAGGEGTNNTLAYSSDGINWTGLGTNIFDYACFTVAWNGYRWVAGGGSIVLPNSLAYSNDGINWFVSSSAYSVLQEFRSLTWGNNLWIGVGYGPSFFIASTTDPSGATGWTGRGSGIFTAGFSIAWNGNTFVAGGNGTNKMAYSSNGTTWFGLGTTLFGSSISSFCEDVVWDGKKFIVGGSNGTTGLIGYSYNGISNWYLVPGSTTIFSQACFGLGTNSLIGSPVVDSQLVLNDNGYGLSNNIDIVSDGYFNTGFTNFSTTINTTKLS